MFRRTGAVLSEHVVEASRILKLVCHGFIFNQFNAGRFIRVSIQGPLVLVPSKHVLVTRSGDEFKVLRAPSESRFPQWIGLANIVKSFSLQPYSATLPVGNYCRSGDNVGVDMEVRLNCCVNPDSSALLQSDEQNPNTALVVHADAVCRGAVLDLLLRSDVVDLTALELSIRHSVEQKADELGVKLLHLEISTLVLASAFSPDIYGIIFDHMAHFSGRFVAEEPECNGHLLTAEMVELSNRLRELESKIQSKSNSADSHDGIF
jgi:hypothetical protein